MSEKIKQSNSSRALYVAWQDQVSKSYYPIGRLEWHAASPAYRFRYLKGANEALAAGFSPFPEFPSIGVQYSSNSLFSIFANRLMPKSRPDYLDYLERLGLPPGTSDIEILARSGGRRETDSIELFPEALKADGGCYETFFLAHGIRYLPDPHHARIDSLSRGDALLVMVDFQNPHDDSALALRTMDRYIVGYLPRYLLDDSWELIQSCSSIDVTVWQVNPSPSPIQQRLLCRLQACWPLGFEPYKHDRFRPVEDVSSNSDKPLYPDDYHASVRRDEARSSRPSPPSP